ncbi:TonB-dependent receptor [Methylosinus sp. sav-2]|uniref:TonB-dependent siderophore receptor n=1 Tax=Methylosinus sp. sav-2 TaxID=2485168 RepID=UPI000AD98E81|nr:TonB-dependent receptor [Methylosinus sp. sav-2]
MGSAIAAATVGFLMAGSGSTSRPAEAAIAPQERTGAVKFYRIDQIPLTEALTAFADQNDLRLSYDARLTRGVRTRGLSGQFTTQDALRALLEGTTLTYRFADNGRSVLITLAQADNGVRNDAGAESLPPIDVGAERAVPAGRPGNGSGGDAKTYNPKNTSTATKIDTPIMETPFSVKAVPQQVLQDQQVIRVEKALQNVSGVLPMPGNQGLGDIFIIRGFFNDTIYRDGFALPGVLGGGTTKRYTANLERIEVLKGPGSILYGRSEPGGIVNLVTKQPLETPYHAIQQQAGSFDFYRTTIDSTGPLNEEKSLLYRVNIAYENAGSFRDFVENEGVFIAPVVRWNIDAATRANFEFEYQQFDERPDPGIPPLGSGPAPIQRTRFVGDPLNSVNKGYRTLYGLNWSHDFDENWTLTHRFTFEHMAFDNRTMFFGKANADGTLGRFYNQAPDTTSDRYYTTLNLTGKIDTGPVRHKLLFGYDYFHIDDKLVGLRNCCVVASPFNIYAPTYLPYTVIPVSPATIGRLDLSQEWHSLYFQDQMELPYNFFAMGGFRFDSATAVNNLANVITTKEEQVSPRGGLLWRPAPWLSVYGSYSQGFGAANSVLRSDGALFPAQTSEQWEAGLKAEADDGRLTATFAYFDLKKRNLPVPDPLNPNLRRTIGEAETRGIEFDVSGEVLPGLRVIGAYSYLPFAKITKDSDASGGYRNQGKRLYLAPEHYGSFWTTYEFQQASLLGLKVGAGVVAVGPREGDQGNSYQLPGYAIVNVMGSYSWRIGPTRVTAQLNIDNLADEHYFVGSNSGNFIMPGAPRTFLGSLKVEF